MKSMTSRNERQEEVVELHGRMQRLGLDKNGKGEKYTIRDPKINKLTPLLLNNRGL